MKPERKQMEVLRRALQATRQKLEELESNEREPIAVVGIGCRFPGGIEGPEQFWQFLLEGGDAVIETPKSRWDLERYYDVDPHASGRMYSRHGAYLEEIEAFDAEFFGIGRREAERMDPQQRMLLETAWHAIENAGFPAPSLRGSNTGVYIGVCFEDYARYSVHSGDPSRIDASSSLGTSRSVGVGRISHEFDLRGPSMSLDTTCSSSLLAVHLAARAVATGECTLALAGGVNAMLSPETSIAFSRLGALSASGRCRTFDASADGYVRGEGCGILVLERLSDALARGAHIWGVIRGSAVNHDGRSNGLTAPNGHAQTAVIEAALRDARCHAEDVHYLEAHGTGTPLGDPIELNAAARAYGLSSERGQPLVVGSVKTNIGHLESAAGVAAMIKALLAVHHGMIPAHLHFETPNPHIRWDELDVEVPHETTMWPDCSSLRRSGVSGFGMSGTNVHLILEEPPSPGPTEPRREESEVLTLSARNEHALRNLATRYGKALERMPEASLEDVCFTANTGRATFEHRAAFVARTTTDLRRALVEFSVSKSKRGSVGPCQGVAERFMNGESIRWDEVYRRRQPRKMSLPGYPFSRERFWHDYERGERTNGTPAKAGSDHAVEWTESELSAYLLDLLGEVTVQSSDQFAMDSRLAEIGVDSLAAVDICLAIKETLGRPVSEELLLEESTTVHDVIQSLQGPLDASPTSEIDFDRETSLPEEIRPAGEGAPVRKPRLVLLSGATGFFGKYLLRELLRESDATIVCLVRAASATAAQSRLTEVLHPVVLSKIEWSRVRCVAGDVGLPSLGLRSGEYDELAASVDAIYHSAAALNYVSPYSQLESTNVRGTIEMLRFACRGKAKRFHLISSVAALEAAAYRGEPVDESREVDRHEGMSVGYSQTKWVAERLTRAAARRGLPVTLHRLPLVSGDSRTGAWLEENVFCMLMKACVEAGAVPFDLDILLDFVPVDSLAVAVAKVTVEPSSLEVSHLNNPRPMHWADFVQIFRGWGYPLEPVPFREWRERIEKQKDNTLRPLLPFLQKEVRGTDGLSYLETQQRGHRPNIRNERTQELLRTRNAELPGVTPELWELYRVWLENAGALGARPGITSH